MATVLSARGKMTAALVTRHEVGDEIVIVNPDPDTYQWFGVGKTGVIRDICIGDPNDGDETFVMFRVRIGRRTWSLSAGEFVPAAEAAAHLWARRQLNALRCEVQL